ncbi:methyl-accepting chemotaxis protein [Thiorhodococcus fuscus]|uniref:Methyl-accepting chemotaxis protein n=1 Tax=Thiorhodococcus fuscus TaxID=527200 RepID=A0ABW4YBB1_9GAMM
MNFRSIRFKIALWSGLSLAVLSAVLTLSSVWSLNQQVERERRLALSNAKELLLSSAQEKAKAVEEGIRPAFQTARVLAQTLATLVGQQGGELNVRAASIDREAVNRILQSILREHPGFLGLYTAWEPNAFDGRDAEFVGQPGTDASGRFIPYWSRAADGALALEPLVDYETPGAGDYYLLPKKTGTEQLINPYSYPVQGKEMLITSLVEPILIDGRFQGIAGVDLALGHLQQMIDAAVSNFRDGVGGLAIIANDGTIVAASGRPQLIGKPISALHEDWEEDLKDIQDAKPVVEEDEGNLMAVVPIRFSDATQVWGLQLTLPLSWLEAQVDGAAAQGRQAIAFMIGVAVLVLVLGMGLMLAVATFIVRPIRQLSLALHDISEGEGDLTHDLDDSGRDEIADLARAFNGFQAKLRVLIRQLGDGGGQVAASADQLSATSNRGAGIVSQQQLETDQVATAMNEMTATVAEVARHAAQAAEATRQADQQADSGRAAVGRAVETMQMLSQQVQSATDAIARVSSDAGQITSILDVIGGIADQTNLLALNAAIEAARAGEQGRGFAVVADEVRTLAQRTQNSTREIQEMIDRLQTGTRGAVEVMDAGRDKAQGGLNAVAEAADAIETMASSVAAIKDMNIQIASAAEEQTAVAGEIDRNLANIAQLVDQVSADTSEISGAAEMLKQLASDQNARVGRFKV